MSGEIKQKRCKIWREGRKGSRKLAGPCRETNQDKKNKIKYNLKYLLLEIPVDHIGSDPGRSDFENERFGSDEIRWSGSVGCSSFVDDFDEVVEPGSRENIERQISTEKGRGEKKVEKKRGCRATSSTRRDASSSRPLPAVFASSGSLKKERSSHLDSSN